MDITINNNFINFTSLDFELVEKVAFRKQFSLLNSINYYKRNNIKISKKKISEISGISPNSFSRSIRRLNNKNINGYFYYNYKNKMIQNSYELSKNKLFIKVPTHLIRIGALDRTSLIILGYLSALNEKTWNDSVKSLCEQINYWLNKRNIRLKISLSSMYRSIKSLVTLKMVERQYYKFLKMKKRRWSHKSKICIKEEYLYLTNDELIELLKKLIHKPFTLKFLKDFDWNNF